MQSSLPFITISMPVRNEERFIGQTLNELLRQEYPEDRYEIIVADGESIDSTREIVSKIARANPRVILMSNHGRLPSSGRNVGFKNGKGDIFLVIDGHCLINNRQLLKNVAECFNKSGAQCLGRPQPFIIPEKRDEQRAIALARTSWLGHSGNSLIHADREGFVSPVSVGCAYKREVFEKIGYVDESFDACEDVEFNFRVEKAGLKTYFSNKIAVYYYPRKNISELWKQLVRYGEGRARFISRHPAAVNLDIFLPLIFLSGVFTGPFAIFINKFLFLFYLLSLLVYLSIISFESVRLSGSDGFSFKVILMKAFFIIHTGLGFGFAKGVVRELSRINFIPKLYVRRIKGLTKWMSH